MNRVEVGQLLTYLRTVDNRKWDDIAVETWLGFVGDLRLADCIEASRRHYSTSSEYLKPNMIREGADVIATERAQLDQLELERGLTPRPIPDALFGEERERGRALLTYVGAALKAAGQDIVMGARLGARRAGNVAAKATTEWLKVHRKDSPPVVPRGYTCGRTMCRCTHGVDPVTGVVCEGGWIHDDRPNPDPASHGSVTRCTTCAGERAKILADAPNLSAAGKALRLSKDR